MSVMGDGEDARRQPSLLYNRDGVIVRRLDLTADVIEAEMEFLAAGFSDSALYSVAAISVAFQHRLRLNFVPTSHLLNRYALLRAEFDAHAEKVLVRTVLATQEHAAHLFLLAKKYFYDTTETMETNTSEALRPFKKTDFKGQALGEAFAAYLLEQGIEL